MRENLDLIGSSVCVDPSHRSCVAMDADAPSSLAKSRRSRFKAPSRPWRTSRFRSPCSPHPKKHRRGRYGEVRPPQRNLMMFANLTGSHRMRAGKALRAKRSPPAVRLERVFDTARHKRRFLPGHGNCPSERSLARSKRPFPIDRRPIRSGAHPRSALDLDEQGQRL